MSASESNAPSSWFKDERQILDDAIDLRATFEGLCQSISIAKDIGEVRTAALMACLDLRKPGSVVWPVDL